MPGAGEAWESSPAEERHQETGVALRGRKRADEDSTQEERAGKNC